MFLIVYKKQGKLAERRGLDAYEWDATRPWTKEEREFPTYHNREIHAPIFTLNIQNLGNYHNLFKNG